MTFAASGYSNHAGAHSNGPRKHTYKSGDTIAAIKADSYFDAIADYIETGDFMEVFSSHVSGGGASIINLTNTAGVITVAFESDLTAPA